MQSKNIVIVGLGGVGGYFGFKINQTNETTKQHHVTFIARNETYNRVKNEGLTLLSPEHENSVTHPNSILQNISEIENPDLILVCVKEYDLENVCKQLQNVITDQTLLLPMMNGADIYDRMKSVLPNSIILPSCVYVASHIKEKGVVEHKGNPGKLIFGKDPQHPDLDISWLINLLDSSLISYECKDNPFIDIWTKFTFIASFGLVTAKHNSSIGAVCTNSDQKQEATEIMKEIKSIADAKGIALPGDIIDKTFEKSSTFPPDTPTSLQLDVNSNEGNSELELFAGAIINYGSDLGVSYPNTLKIYDEIKSFSQSISQ